MYKKVVGGPLQDWPLRREIKFFVREIRKTCNFWQLIGGGPTSGPPKSQNATKSRPKRPKCKEMEAQKAKMQGNEGPKRQNERKSKPKRPKCKEMKAHNAKITGNEGPEG